MVNCRSSSAGSPMGHPTLRASFESEYLDVWSYVDEWEPPQALGQTRGASNYQPSLSRFKIETVRTSLSAKTAAVRSSQVTGSCQILFARSRLGDPN